MSTNCTMCGHKPRTDVKPVQELQAFTLHVPFQGEQQEKVCDLCKSLVDSAVYNTVTKIKNNFLGVRS